MAIKIKHFKTRVVRYPALAFAGLAAMVALGFERGLRKADWGTWVGSIGTVGTLVGTIWLATTERRNRSRQEYALAQVTAASFVEEIRVATHVLEKGIQYLRHRIGNPEVADLEALHRINAIGRIWTPAETVPLTALHGKVAMRLSEASAKFNTTQRNLWAVSESLETLSDDELRSFFIQQISEYEQLTKIFDDVTGILRYACLDH